MKNKNLTAIVTSLGMIATAHSATISWTGGDITGDSDVSTNGSLVFAINGSNADGTTNTINTVDFVTSTRGNLATESNAQSPGSEQLTTTLGNDNGGSFARAGLGVGTIGDLIVGGFWGTTSGNSAAIDITGLTVGRIYEIQLFTNDARSSRHDGFEMDLDDGNGGAGIRIQLNNSPDNTDSGASEAGDFAIGTFTADSSDQSFTLSGFLDDNPNAGRTQVQAIQLRDLGAAVPEPSSALLALVGLSFGLRRRR